MVRRLRHSFGFTMIELIFAIVVIAISVMSLPMMTQVTNQGIEESLIQEAVFASSAELMGATAGYWDGNSMEDINESSLSRVIDLSLDCNATSRLRPGHINQPYHRRCLDNPLATAANAGAGTLDAMVQVNQAIFLNPNPEATGYKASYTSDISVVRNGHIKTITSTIKNNGNIVTVLRAQSANIGEIDYFKRTF